MLPIRCIAIGRSIALSYQLCRYWQKAAGGEKDKLSFLHRRASGHIRDLKGLLHELNQSSILAIIILNAHLYFWTGFLMKALCAWSKQGQHTFIYSSENSLFLLIHLSSYNDLKGYYQKVKVKMTIPKWYFNHGPIQKALLCFAPFILKSAHSLNSSWLDLGLVKPRPAHFDSKQLEWP